MSDKEKIPSASPFDWEHPERVHINPAEMEELSPEDQDLLMRIAGGIADLEVRGESPENLAAKQQGEAANGSQEDELTREEAMDMVAHLLAVALMPHARASKTDAQIRDAAAAHMNAMELTDQERAWVEERAQALTNVTRGTGHLSLVEETEQEEGDE